MKDKDLEPTLGPIVGLELYCPEDNPNGIYRIVRLDAAGETHTVAYLVGATREDANSLFASLAAAWMKQRGA